MCLGVQGLGHCVVIEAHSVGLHRLLDRVDLVNLGRATSGPLRSVISLVEPISRPITETMNESRSASVIPRPLMPRVHGFGEFRVGRQEQWLRWGFEVVNNHNFGVNRFESASEPRRYPRLDRLHRGRCSSNAGSPVTSNATQQVAFGGFQSHLLWVVTVAATNGVAARERHLPVFTPNRNAGDPARMSRHRRTRSAPGRQRSRRVAPTYGRHAAAHRG